MILRQNSLNTCNLSQSYSDGLKLSSAQTSNISDIENIISNCHVTNHPDEKNGFLCHFPSNPELLFRIRNGKFNQVAYYDSKNVGFLTAFSSLEAWEYLNLGLLSYENSILNELLQVNKFIWLDQLAIINRSFYRKKIGSRLILNLIQKSAQIGYNYYYGTISVSPETNLASISFFIQLGFEMSKIIELNNRKWILIKLKIH